MTVVNYLLTRSEDGVDGPVFMSQHDTWEQAAEVALARGWGRWNSASFELDPGTKIDAVRIEALE